VVTLKVLKGIFERLPYSPLSFWLSTLLFLPPALELAIDVFLFLFFLFIFLLLLFSPYRILLSSRNSLKKPFPWSLLRKREFLRVPNYGAPSIEQIDSYLTKAEKTINRGGAVLVHCGGGKGRAGTLLACYLLRYGLALPRNQIGEIGGCMMNTGEALELLRRLRPGSVESTEQEKRIKEYAEVLWQRATIEEEVEEEEGEVKGEEGCELSRYPSTPHLPFSPEVHSDDTQLPLDVCDKLFAKVRNLLPSSSSFLSVSSLSSSSSLLSYFHPSNLTDFHFNFRKKDRSGSDREARWWQLLPFQRVCFRSYTWTRSDSRVFWTN
jgi:hypothetical protein